jgi:hypothetical protein
VEQQAIYEKFDFEETNVVTNDIPTAAPAGGTDLGWGIKHVPAVVTADQYAADQLIIRSAKINYFICPSGNHAGAKTTPFVSSYVGVAGGTNFTAAKYAAAITPSFGNGASVSATTVPTLANVQTLTKDANGNVTAAGYNFAKVSLENGVFPAGKAGTLKMADGTSNTVVFGEISWKAGARDGSLNPWTNASTQLGAWYQGAVITHAAASSTATNYQSYYAKVVTPYDYNKYTETWADTGSAVGSHKILNGGKGNQLVGATKVDTIFTRASNAGSWGSNHTSVVIFGLGDGSVRGVSDSVANDVICNFAAAGDGVAVTLP